MPVFLTKVARDFGLSLPRLGSRESSESDNGRTFRDWVRFFVIDPHTSLLIALRVAGTSFVGDILDDAGGSLMAGSNM